MSVYIQCAGTRLTILWATIVLWLANRNTVESDLANTSLSRNLIYTTLCGGSPLLNCTQFYLVYLTHLWGTDILSDRSDPTVHIVWRCRPNLARPFSGSVPENGQARLGQSPKMVERDWVSNARLLYTYK